MEPTHAPDHQTLGQRLTSVFEFLKAYTHLKIPVVRKIEDQVRTLSFKELPRHPSVVVAPRQPFEEGERDESVEDVFTVTRPTIRPCPLPPEKIASWLKPGWESIQQTVQVEVQRESVVDGQDVPEVELFTDDASRVAALAGWQLLRDVWTVNEQPARRASQVFETLYEWYGLLEREGERLELLVGDGVIRYQDQRGKMAHHPVLLQRVELEFRPEKTHPQFIIRRRDERPELYVDLLQDLPDVNVKQLSACITELQALDIDPLGEEETQGFLRRLIQGLFPDVGVLLEAGAVSSERVSIERDPVLFIRQRRVGVSHAFDLVLADIQKRVQSGENFSAALEQILGGQERMSSTARSAEGGSLFGNEDKDILLSLPANREQLLIAKQLAHRQTVLVQGPPGTGKTHTIANILGHFLAQGKRVLVTAQTPKALRVLRSKIAPSLQPLCVSVLQKDRQNADELQQAVKQMHVHLSQDVTVLEEAAEQLRGERLRLLQEIQETRHELLAARQGEIREIVYEGKGIRPIDAAKLVAARAATDAWIPGPIQGAGGLSLSVGEVATLYQMNERISLADEKELRAGLPDLSRLPTPSEFLETVKGLAEATPGETESGKEYWDQNRASDVAEFEEMLTKALSAVDFFKESADWELEVIQAGREGESSQRIWVALLELIQRTSEVVRDAQELILTHGPTLETHLSSREALAIIDEVAAYVESGKSLTVVTRLTKRDWHALLASARIDGAPLDPQRLTQIKALQAYLRVQLAREELCSRWQRQMTVGGALSVTDLGEHPERSTRQFLSRIRLALDWHTSVWVPLEIEMKRHGFDWALYVDSVPAEPGNNAELLRMRKAILGDFGALLEARAAALRHHALVYTLHGWLDVFPDRHDREAVTMTRLRQACKQRNAEEYALVHAEVLRLQSLVDDLRRRETLLQTLNVRAGAWSSALRLRIPPHDVATPPGDVQAAWEWRELHDELEQRAAVSLEHLQERLESLSQQMLQLTTQLVEKQTWAHQVRQVTPQQKRALAAYATLRGKLTKDGKGKKDPSVRLAARTEMEMAKGAVPVWIMPLNEVVELFDPLSTRFDVVIVDEASQCDPLALFALYLGKQTIVVGDDEQVTPLSIGKESGEVMQLMQTFLATVPHKELYDGQTSLYEFATIAFGGVIRLVEHFRCAPDIIAFSNALCYQGEMKPLREKYSIVLTPHVIPYRVTGRLEDGGNVNLEEARTIASLICAAVTQPEYRSKTMGVTALLGDRQAQKIEELLHLHLSPELYQHHQILCGNPTHFQGDERDVMFLSMVDSPAEGPLPLRDADAQHKLFKKRYNVATSRARDQMWLVYSLDPEVDLKAGDIRRRLIEHARDPAMWQRQLAERVPQSESVFEERVLRALVAKGYQVQSRYLVGAFQIDLVVSGNGKRLAIACDGETWHGEDRLTADLERQAILERLGWKFVCLRGSLFFREPERALQEVYRRLESLGIFPAVDAERLSEQTSTEVVTRVQHLAAALRQQWLDAEQLRRQDSQREA